METDCPPLLRRLWSVTCKPIVSLKRRSIDVCGKALVLLGVLFASNADITFNALGASIAALAVFVTAFYQIWVKTVQKDLKLSAFQLLYYQAPVSATMLLAILPFVENLVGEGGVLHSPWTVDALLAVLSSSVLAFVVNLSIFLVIGKTSAISYNVLGHFKLCTVLAGGFLLLGEPLNMRQGAGIAVALLGVFAYGHIQLQAPASDPALPRPALAELKRL
eukprot:m.95489 g.95489  ORF g.95489 m.95489 type:complete len:220 (+) comp51291_c0_seq3:373-1032(+)